jgi:hypothetical protein
MFYSQIPTDMHHTTHRANISTPGGNGPLGVTTPPPSSLPPFENKEHSMERERVQA